MKQPTIAAIRRIPLTKGGGVETVAGPYGRGLFLSAGEARGLVDILKRARTTKEVEAALEYANTLLEGHGVDAVWDSSGDTLVGLYINMGDQYDETIIADLPAGRFYQTDLETWVLKRRRRYDIP